MNLPQRIEMIVRQYPYWSDAERCRLDRIVEEILHHCQTGNGNTFCQIFLKLVVDPSLESQNFAPLAPRESGPAQPSQPDQDFVTVHRTKDGNWFRSEGKMSVVVGNSPCRGLRYAQHRQFRLVLSPTGLTSFQIRREGNWGLTRSVPERIRKALRAALDLPPA